MKTIPPINGDCVNQVKEAIVLPTDKLWVFMAPHPIEHKTPLNVESFIKNEIMMEL